MFLGLFQICEIKVNGLIMVFQQIQLKPKFGKTEGTCLRTLAQDTHNDRQIHVCKESCIIFPSLKKLFCKKLNDIFSFLK